MKEIIIEYSKFKEMKDKMIKVLANLEDVKASIDTDRDINQILETMISEMNDALKLATGKVHGSIDEPKILEFKANRIETDD